MKKPKVLNIIQIAREVSQVIADQNHLAESDITCDTKMVRIQKEKTANYFLSGFLVLF